MEKFHTRNISSMWCDDQPQNISRSVFHVTHRFAFKFIEGCVIRHTRLVLFDGQAWVQVSYPVWRLVLFAYIGVTRFHLLAGNLQIPGHWLSIACIGCCLPLIRSFLEYIKSSSSFDGLGWLSYLTMAFPTILHRTYLVGLWKYYGWPYQVLIQVLVNILWRWVVLL